MDLKKIKEKNPGFDFSVKGTRKVPEAVLHNALKSKLNIDAYNQKYADTVISSKDSGKEESAKPAPVDDSNWKFIQKVSTNSNVDFPEEPKSSFFDGHGEEVAAED
jgi:hypothetical protein